MKHSKDLKATGGILVNGVMFLLSKTLESVDKKLTGGLVTEITGEISKNFVVSHFGTFGTYGKLYDLVQTPHPDNLNHDIERLIKEAALVAIDLLRTIYLEELANDAEFFKGIRHDEMKEYLSAIDIYFSNARSDIKGYIDIYKVDKKISDNPNQYFSKVSEYLITVSGIRFDKQSKFRIEEFHKKWLPFCFQLAFKEALKNDENGFKAFQLAFFEDLKGWQGITDRALSKIQKSIDRVKSGKVIFPAAKLDSIGLKLTNILNSHYTGIEAKLTALEQQIGSQFSDFYAFNSEVRADLVKLNNKSDELLDLSRRSVSTNSEILRKIQNLSSKRDLLISQKIFSGSTEVLEVVAEIESLPEQIKELNKKYVLYLEKYSKNSDYSDLVKISFENWKAATERLNYLIETLDNTKSTVVSLYHLLFKQKPVGKRSRTMKVAIKLFEDGKFSELEEFLSSEAREKERAIVLHEQHLIDKKKSDLAFGDLINAMVILRTDLAYDLARYQKAKTYFQKSVDIFPGYLNHWQFAKFLEDEQPILALNHYSQSKAYIEDRQSLEYGLILIEIGRVQYELADARQSIETLSQAAIFFANAVSITRQIADSHLFTVKCYLATAYQNIWEINESRRLLLEASRILDDYDEKTMTDFLALKIYLLSRLGDLESLVHNLDVAEGYYTEIFQADRQISEDFNSSIRSAMLFNIALFYLFAGKLEKARDILERAVQSSEMETQFFPIKNAHFQSVYHHNLANIYNTDGQIERAKKEFNKAINICSQYLEVNPVQFIPVLTAVMLDLANMLKRCDEYGPAEIMYEKALMLISENLHRSIRELYVQMTRLAYSYGDLLIKSGDDRRVGELYSETLQFLLSVVEEDSKYLKPELAELYRAIAYYCEQFDNKEIVLEMYERSVSEFETVILSAGGMHAHRFISTLVDQAVFTGNQGMLDEAILSMNRALEVCNTLKESRPSIYKSQRLRIFSLRAGLLARMKKLNESEDDFREAINLIEELGAANPGKHDDELGHLLQNRSILFEISEDWSGCLSCLSDAFEIVEKLVSINPAVYTRQAMQILSSMAHCNEMLGAIEEEIGVCEKAVNIAVLNAFCLPSVWQILSEIYRRLQRCYNTTQALKKCLSYLCKERALSVIFSNDTRLTSMIDEKISNVLEYFTYDEQSFQQALEREVVAFEAVISLSISARKSIRSDRGF